MKRTALTWESIGDTIVVVSKGQISDEECSALAKYIKDVPVTKYLGISAGTTEMTSVQRKLLADAVKSRNMRVAVVTDDRLVRGLITAASWLGVNVKAFSIADINDALRHLQVPATMTQRIIDTIGKLKA
jgi:hypothetical protein